MYLRVSWTLNEIFWLICPLVGRTQPRIGFVANSKSGVCVRQHFIYIFFSSFFKNPLLCSEMMMFTVGQSHESLRSENTVQIITSQTGDPDKTFKAEFQTSTLLLWILNFLQPPFIGTGGKCFPSISLVEIIQNHLLGSLNWEMFLRFSWRKSSGKVYVPAKGYTHIRG